MSCVENPNQENDRTLATWKLCDCIRQSVDSYHAQQLRKSFLRFDSCSSGYVQGCDFASILRCSLNGCLSESDICMLADYFKSADMGGVAYEQFLEVIAGENGGSDATAVKERSLSSSEHRRLALVMMEIAQALRYRENVLRPFFEDYDLIARNGGSVTIAYFKRVLYFLGITLRRTELELLMKRFVVSSYKIDYESFVEEIDQLLRYLDTLGPVDRCSDKEVPSKIIAVELPKIHRPEVGTIKLEDVLEKNTAYHPCLETTKSERDLQCLMLRIQRHIWENRIRTREFFEQYDLFGCGWISRSQFVRSLDAIGLSGLHRLPLTDLEIKSICDFYQDRRDINKICWDRFTDDVDEVFTVKHLDKGTFKNVESPPEEVKCLHREGEKDPPERIHDLAEDVVGCIRTLVRSRRILIRPVFKDFDPHRNGHVSRSQLGEALSMAGIFLTEEQIYALQQRYSDDLGFNYVEFLNRVDPMPGTFCKGEDTQDNFKLLNHTYLASPHEFELDIVRVLAKVKGQVVRRKLRIIDYMKGFDPLNHFRITKQQFERGLSTASIDLTPTEVCTLAKMFKTPLQTTIDYKKFCDTIAEVDYQCNLEKAPLIVPLQHFPSEDGPFNHLNFEERTIASQTLQKLARQADMVSNLGSVLKDFDRNHLGLVNRNQLIRALATRNLHTAISSREFEVLTKCFGVEKGYRREVNYRALLTALDYLYANRHNHPF